MNYLQHFKKYGFVHLPGVITEAELSDIRSVVVNDRPGAFVKDIDFFLEHECLYKHQFSEKITSALQQIFGLDYCVVNDVNIQVEQYYNDRDDHGWHIDAGSEGLSKYLFEPTYGFAKVGIYTEKTPLNMGVVSTLSMEAIAVSNI